MTNCAYKYNFNISEFVNFIMLFIKRTDINNIKI